MMMMIILMYVNSESDTLIYTMKTEGRACQSLILHTTMIATFMSSWLIAGQSIDQVIR